MSRATSRRASRQAATRRPLTPLVDRVCEITFELDKERAKSSHKHHYQEVPLHQRLRSQLLENANDKQTTTAPHTHKAQVVPRDEENVGGLFSQSFCSFVAHPSTTASSSTSSYKATCPRHKKLVTTGSQTDDTYESSGGTPVELPSTTHTRQSSVSGGDLHPAQMSHTSSLDWASTTPQTSNHSTQCTSFSTNTNTSHVECCNDSTVRSSLSISTFPTSLSQSSLRHKLKHHHHHHLSHTITPLQRLRIQPDSHSFDEHDRLKKRNDTNTHDETLSRHTRLMRRARRVLSQDETMVSFSPLGTQRWRNQNFSSTMPLLNSKTSVSLVEDRSLADTKWLKNSASYSARHKLSDTDWLRSPARLRANTQLVDVDNYNTDLLALP